MDLKDFSKDAVAQSAGFEINNEGKKRKAFAYLNEKLAEAKLTATEQEIDDAIEVSWKESLK